MISDNNSVKNNPFIINKAVRSSPCPPVFLYIWRITGKTERGSNFHSPDALSKVKSILSIHGISVKQFGNVRIIYEWLAQNQKNEFA